jgi:hypothetical protein
VGIDVAAAPATEKPATAAERAAAQRLGSVYRYLNDRAFPIGKWALPETTPGPANKNAFLDVALGEVYGSHQKLDPQWRPSFSRYEHYRRDYAKIINPRLEGAIWNWAQAALEAEALALGGLLIRIEHDPLVPQRLHTLAQAVGKAAGGFHPTHEDITSSYVVSSRGDFPQLVPDLAKLQRALRQRIGPAVRQQKDDLLSTLFVHPLGVEILRHYADDQYRATRYAAGLVSNAQSSVWDFRAELAARGNEAHVWRYPTLVVGGVTALGCHNIPGFSEYAVAIGQVLGQSTIEHFVGFASMAICCLTLVFSGPLGLVVLGAADLALAGTAAGLAYLRENEQELGAEGSAFRRESDQFATSSEYSETLLAGAAALLSGIAFFKAARAYRALVKIKPMSIEEVFITRGEVSARPRNARAAPDPTATLKPQVSERGLEPPASDARALDRGAVSGEMKTAERGGEGKLKAAPAPEVSKSVEGQALERADITQEERLTRPADPTTESRSATRDELTAPEDVGARGTQAAGSTGDTVPAKELRRELKEKLEAKIKALEAERARISAEKGTYDREVKYLNEQLRKSSQPPHRQAELRARLKSLLEEGGSGEPYYIEQQLKNFKRLRRATEQEYFEALSARARKHPDYITVGGGEVDKRFLPIPSTGSVRGSTTRSVFSVEHAYARSKMFLNPKFLKLSWDQQVALFAYRENLLKIPGVANSARSNRAYRFLPSRTWQKFIPDQASLSSLADLEEEMEKKITFLIDNPHEIPPLPRED